MVHLGGNGFEGSFSYALPLLEPGDAVRYWFRGCSIDTCVRDPLAGSDDPYGFTILQLAYETTFDEAEGWIIGVEGDDATGGLWELGVPVMTISLGKPVQPEGDHTTGDGSCFVTDPSGGSDPYDSDVDAGRTTLESPLLNLSGLWDARLQFWYWFSNHLGTSPWHDSLKVMLSNDAGQTWDLVFWEWHGDDHWRRAEIQIDDYLSLTDRMLIRFEASDLGYESLVEACVDDVRILTTGGIPTGVDDHNLVSDASLIRLTMAGQNPTADGAIFRLLSPTPMELAVDVVDLEGRTLRNLAHGTFGPSSQEIRWDGLDWGGVPVATGRYWVLARQDDGRILARQEVIVVR